MSATPIHALLDAHDALLRDCVEGRLTLAEFLSAYGDFPHANGLDEYSASPTEREALRLLRKRLVFHSLVARVISGVGEAAKLGSVEASEVGDFLPAVAMMRLRELFDRYPQFEVPGR
jgi:hypothetical protein